MTDSTEGYKPLGTHLIRVDGDSIYWIARGPLKLTDMHELLALYASIRNTYGQLFAFYNAEEATGIEADARQFAASQPRTTKEADLQVAFGVSFAVRVLLNLIVRAQKLLHGRIVRFHIFDNEANARAYFEAERAAIRRKKAS